MSKKNKSIKMFLKKHKVLYDILLIIKHKKDGLFLDLIANNENAVMLSPCSCGLGKPAIMTFDCTSEYGFFFYIKLVLEFLFYCDNTGFIPRILWSKSIYYDDSIKETSNPFEYFFEKPYNLDEIDINKYPSVVYSTGQTKYIRKYISGNIYNPGSEYISKMGYVMKKYLKFNKKTNESINKFINNKMIDSSVLGVHMRGTDFKQGQKHHPQYVELSEYIKTIEEVIKEYNFKRIFVATDDQDLLNGFLEHFNNIDIIFSDNTIRGSGDVGIHILALDNKKISPYQETLNLICDVSALALCGGIVSGVSNVSMFARIYKKSLDDDYLVDRILDKGYVGKIN